MDNHWRHLEVTNHPLSARNPNDANLKSIESELLNSKDEATRSVMLIRNGVQNLSQNASPGFWLLFATFWAILRNQMLKSIFLLHHHHYFLGNFEICNADSIDFAFVISGVLLMWVLHRTFFSNTTRFCFCYFCVILMWVLQPEFIPLSGRLLIFSGRLLKFRMLLFSFFLSYWINYI